MLDYNSYVAELQRLAVTNSNDTVFNALIPNVIDYAEQRIYRELDLLSTVTTDSTKVFVASNPELALPTDRTWVTVQQVNVITPVGATTANGERKPLTPASRQFLNYVYGSAETADVPQYFAMKDAATIVVGPWPDAAYRVEFVGTIRPIPLSPQNKNTYLTDRLPDLFVAASMVFVTGYQRDFGQQSDDPAKAVSWETQYKTLFASADAEELRKKLAAPRSE